MIDTVRRGLERFLPARLAQSLSAQLLVLTVAFVMLAEILIYVPSVANYRLNWLTDRLNAAQTASLAVEAALDRSVRPELEAELLRNAEVQAVALKRDNRRELLLASPRPGMVSARYDLRGATPVTLILDAFDTLLFGGGRVIAVTGEPRFGGGDFIEIVLDDTSLRNDLLAYSRNILVLSLVISVFTAGLVFMVLNRTLVRPMMRITANMVRFRENPEDASRVMAPSARRDEIGIAERELAMMQGELRQALRQKTRLAALGSAVAKINHDLRNILASAQLISDRLGSVDDPRVQALAPRLFGAIDRAISLATSTMKYGKAEEAPPEKQWIPLADLVREVIAAAVPEGGPEASPKVGPEAGGGGLETRIAIGSDEQVFADPDQLFRILLNLVRNSVQALEPAGGRICITCEMSPQGPRLVIEDDGPGLPPAAREHLFEPFTGSASRGGTGLGLAVAADLTALNGGRLELAESRPGRTAFHLYLPPDPVP